MSTTSTDSERRSELPEALMEVWKGELHAWLLCLFSHLGYRNWGVSFVCSKAHDESDQYAVAVVKDGVVVGRLSKDLPALKPD